MVTKGPVERKLFYTAEVLANIKVWVDDGVPRQEIAVKLGTTVSRLAVNCSYRGISLTNKRRVKHALTLDFQATTLFGLEAEATRRGWSVEHLIEQFCEIAHRDDLYHAVLDP